MKSRNPMILVPLFVAATAAVYLALVQPCAKRLSQDRQTLADLRSEMSRRTIDIQSEAMIKERTEKVVAEIDGFASLQLEPLLESYAMRAKSIVDLLAKEAGLVDVEFSDRPLRALPVVPGKPVPSSLHARRPVLLSCYGDYAAIVSFILRVERDLPHVALGGLRIFPGGGQDPELQRAEIVLEWPAKGAKKE